jgi:hypothetical protein
MDSLTKLAKVAVSLKEWSMHLERLQGMGFFVNERQVFVYIFVL